MQIWRRTLRALLVPVALIVLVVGTSLPASAAADPSSNTTVGTTTAAVHKVVPLSLNW